MSTSARTLTPEQQNALAKFQAFVGRQAASTPQTQGVASLNTQSNPLLQNIKSSVGTYIDPIEGKDYTDRLVPYLAKQLTDRGITDFKQFETQVIKGSPIQFVDTGEGLMQIDATPDVTKYYNKTTGKEINPVLFADTFGTEYVLTDQGVQKQFDPTIKDADGKSFDIVTLKKLYTQIAPNVDLKRSSGGVFNATIMDNTNIGFNSKEAAKFFGGTPTVAQMVVLDMARGLANAGVTDIGQLKKGEISEYHPISDGDGYYRTRIGNVGPNGQEINLGHTYTGDGGTSYSVELGDDGKPKFYTTGFDTSGKKMVLMAASMFAPHILGPLVGAAGAAGAGSGLAGIFANAGLSAAAANALASGFVHGTVQGGLSSLAGGKFGKGFTSGFVGGAAPVVAGPVTQTLTQAGLSPELAKITTSGAIGGLSAAAGGKNIGQGVLGSALNTGIGIGMDKAGITQLPAPVRGVVTEGISSAIRGKPFDLASAAQNAALNYGLNQTIGPQGMKAVTTFLLYKNMADSLGRVKASPSNAIAAFNAFKARRQVGG